MRLPLEKLQAHLADALAPVYLISGDEPLLTQEAADTLRAAARTRFAFSEREIYHADARFDWNRLRQEADSLSLFAERRLLEVRLPTGKPGRDGARILADYCESPAPDTLLLIITGKLDGTSLRSKWVKQVESRGVLVQVWPVPVAQMPRWIDRRLRKAGITASQQALTLLADRVEGNLLAAVQEIEKLKLLATEAEVDVDMMSTVVADSARFNVFNLVDRLLEGDVRSVARHLRGLQKEGTEPGIVLWAIARELRTLLAAQDAVTGGKSPEIALRQLKVWDRRIPLVKAALRRLKPGHLAILLRQSGAVDRAIKGVRDASPWDELAALALSAAGTSPLSGASLKMAFSDNH